MSIYYTITISSFGSSSDLSSTSADESHSTASSESSLLYKISSTLSKSVKESQTITEAAIAWLQGKISEDLIDDDGDDDEEEENTVENVFAVPLWTCTSSVNANSPEYSTLWDELSADSEDLAMEIELKYDETILRTGYPLIRA